MATVAMPPVYWRQIVGGDESNGRNDWKVDNVRANY